LLAERFIKELFQKETAQSAGTSGLLTRRLRSSTGKGSPAGRAFACNTFFHPDFTVGPGVSPDPAVGFQLLVGFTTDRELRR